ncbi:MAG: hypothetical protein ACO1TE_00290 [Prosthecobacter sp.]
MKLGVCSLILLPLLAVSAADSSSKPVLLIKGQPLRSGTLVREKRDILVERGRSRQVNTTATSDVSTRYSQRLNLVHKIGGPGMEELRVSDFMCEWSHFNGPTPPPNEQPSPLASKTLRARKTGARWDYDLAQGKPTPEERSTLDQLAVAASLLDLLSICIGNNPHKAGETWKTEIPAPRGKAVGHIVMKGIQCTLASVDEKPDGPHATITVSGQLSIERPLNFNSHVDITFEASLVRRLTDMLDVETKIKGLYTLKGEANLAGAGKTQLDFEYPYTLTRTLKIEPK